MRAALRTDYPESGNSLPRSSSLGYRLTGALTVQPWELRLPSPDGLRPSGSSVRALQVRLNRGSTSCTACRGAAATWARHAIGLANSSRGDQLSTWRAIIGIIARARKTRISFPHACTLITYPQTPAAGHDRALHQGTCPAASARGPRAAIHGGKRSDP